jgi:hypothetical protein
MVEGKTKIEFCHIRGRKTVRRGAVLAPVMEVPKLLHG